MQRTSLLLACSSAVNGRDKKQMEEKITGYIDHIIFRNEENGYTVLVMITQEEEITCVGNLQAISQGETI